LGWAGLFAVEAIRRGDRFALEESEEVTTDDMEIVSVLRTALADKVGKERFELWFGSRSRIDLVEGTLCVYAPSQFFLDWIRSHFREEIEAAGAQTLGYEPELSFVLDDTIGQATEPTLVVSSDGPSERLTLRPVSVPMFSKPEPAPAPARRAWGDLESFVVGPSNRLAHASADRAARQLGEISPLVIHGPTGVGKTHLLQGLWSDARRHHRSANILMLSAEQFVTDFLQALRGSGLPSFRSKYRHVDLLVIDDLQFFCGKRATQIELHYTIDSLLANRRQVVFACDRPPADLVDLGPELIARLQSGLVCPIHPPEYETRLGIVGHMARRLDLELPASVQELVASRLTRHARELSGALCRLKATGEALDQPITRSVAEEALADMIQASTRPVRLPDIEKAVCHVFGHYFGGRTHSTVISAQKRVDGWLSRGEPLELEDRRMEVDEALRQVERFLEAG
jgi:chromosomal replication initiator protein